jgi:hypothetical protein
MCFRPNFEDFWTIGPSEGLGIKYVLPNLRIKYLTKRNGKCLIIKDFMYIYKNIGRNLEINGYNFSCKKQNFNCNGHMWLQTL